MHQAQFFFRVAKNGQQGFGTYYRLVVWDPGQEDPTGHGHDMSQGFLAVERYQNAHAKLLKQRYHSNTVTGSNEITVRAYGNRMSVIVNGERVLRLVDPEPLRYGGVGVGEIWETNGWFDNARVWQRVS